MLNLDIENNPIYHRERAFFETSIVKKVQRISYLVFFGLLGLAYIGLFALSDRIGASEIGLTLILTTLIFQILLLLFCLPPISGGSMPRERNNETLDILLTTTLTNTRLILGKLSAVLMFNLRLVFLVAPLYLLGFFFVAADYYSPDADILILAIVCIQFLMAILVVSWTCISFWLSTRLRTTLQTTVTTYILALLFIFGPPAIEFFYFELVLDFPYYSYELNTVGIIIGYGLRCLSFIHIVVDIVDAGVSGDVMRNGFLEATIFIFFYASLSVGAFFLARRSISKLRN